MSDVIAPQEDKVTRLYEAMSYVFAAVTRVRGIKKRIVQEAEKACENTAERTEVPSLAGLLNVIPVLLNDGAKDIREEMTVIQEILFDSMPVPVEVPPNKKPETIESYPKVMRIAEAYHNFSEAVNMLGRLADAITGEDSPIMQEENHRTALVTLLDVMNNLYDLCCNRSNECDEYVSKIQNALFLLA